VLAAARAGEGEAGAAGGQQLPAAAAAVAEAHAHAHTRAASPALIPGVSPNSGGSMGSVSIGESAALARAVAAGWAPTVKVAGFGLSRHKLGGYVPTASRRAAGVDAAAAMGAATSSSSGGGGGAAGAGAMGRGVCELYGGHALPYLAPELVADPERVTEKADVWSLGVVMWELATRTTPHQVGGGGVGWGGLGCLIRVWRGSPSSCRLGARFATSLPTNPNPPTQTHQPKPHQPTHPTPQDLTPQQILSRLCSGSLQLEVPPWCEPEWGGLVEACLEPNPAHRPSMKDLARQLEAIRDALEGGGEGGGEGLEEEGPVGG